MSLRSKLKVPDYGLFYFEVDKTVSVVPLKKIRKVIKGDNTSKGSVVEIFYAGVVLKAEIIAVDGKWIVKVSFPFHELFTSCITYNFLLFLDNEKNLDQLSYAFLSDPNNAHLFPRNFSDEEDMEISEVAPPVDKVNKSVKYFLLTLRLYQASNFIQDIKLVVSYRAGLKIEQIKKKLLTN